MKSLEIDKLEPDPLAATLASTDKETIIVSGYICNVDKATISLSNTRDGTSQIEYPRSAIIAAFSDEKSEKVTLLVEVSARVKIISTVRAGTLNSQACKANNKSMSDIFTGDGQIQNEHSCNCKKEPSTNSNDLYKTALQPDGTIIYRKSCQTKWMWICDALGCRQIPYEECRYYPELGGLSM